MTDDSTSQSTPAERLAHQTIELARIAQQSGGHLEREQDLVGYYLAAIDRSLRELEETSSVTPTGAPSRDDVVPPDPEWLGVGATGSPAGP